MARQSDQLAALTEVARAVGASLNLEQTLCAISTHAARLTRSDSALIFLYAPDTDVLTVRASYNAPEGYLAEVGERRMPPRASIASTAPADRSLTVRAVVERAPAQIADVEAAAQYANRDLLLRWGYRAVLVVPLIWGDQVIGAMSVLRTRAGKFTDREVELVSTFASHSAIALAHARLFREVQDQNLALREALERQTVTTEFLRAISGSFELQPTLQTLVEHASRFCGAAAGFIFILQDGAYHLAADHKAPADFKRLMQRSPLRPSRATVIGRTALEGQPVHIPDVLQDEEYTWAEAQRLGGFRTALGVPLLHERRPIGVIAMWRTEVHPFTAEQIQALASFADQAVLAIEKIRLFREVQDKAAQLELVSRHKSQFLASMSHELRTPLNAIIGFSEVLLDPALGPLADDERGEFLAHILTAGRHLLRLINDVLDLSKIEAGKLEISPEPVSLPDTADGVLGTIRPLAAKKRVQVLGALPPDLPPAWADPPRLKQILFNLVSNAIKFTPEGGSVTVRARTLTGGREEWATEGSSARGFLEVSVSDTGIGIPREHQDRIFEEFERVPGPGGPGQEGTGLGLALVKRLVALHGGRVRVESASGQGSTFSFTIPAADMQAEPERRLRGGD